jgi:hypothetical protein
MMVSRQWDRQNEVQMVLLAYGSLDGRWFRRGHRLLR